MVKKQKDNLAICAASLTREFNRWDEIYKNGTYDPFWPDGVNLNLVRNHILYYKRQIKELVDRDNEELSLFTSEYPDIYFRETPAEVPANYMARADEIRAYAKAQLELYEQDPNFCFIRDHHKEAFPKGETKATRLARINPWKTAGFDKFRKAVLNDDLVSMRRDFRTSYEEKAPLWAEYAKELQDYLSKDHSRDDMTPVRDSGEDEEDYEEELDTEEEFEKEVSAPRPETKPSLQEQIQHAAEKRNENKPIHVKEEQLTLF